MATLTEEETFMLAFSWNKRRAEAAGKSSRNPITEKINERRRLIWRYIKSSFYWLISFRFRSGGRTFLAQHRCLTFFLRRSHKHGTRNIRNSLGEKRFHFLCQYVFGPSPWSNLIWIRFRFSVGKRSKRSKNKIEAEQWNLCICCCCLGNGEVNFKSVRNPSNCLAWTNKASASKWQSIRLKMDITLSIKGTDKSRLNCNVIRPSYAPIRNKSWHVQRAEFRHKSDPF